MLQYKPRSKTSKKGLSIQRDASLRECISCQIPILSIIDLFKISPLPSVVNDIITGYLVNASQPIGYVQLHRPTRRRHHVVCIACHENLTNEALNSGSETIKCPCEKCGVDVRILDVSQNEAW
jgi:hypothetical protein